MLSWFESRHDFIGPIAFCDLPFLQRTFSLDSPSSILWNIYYFRRPDFAFTEMSGISKTIQSWKQKTQSKQQGKAYLQMEDEKNANYIGNYGSRSTNQSARNNKQYQYDTQESEEDIKYLKLLVSYGDEAAMEKLLEIERTRRRAL